eukprot:207467-Amphidinium_carterae.1
MSIVNRCLRDSCTAVQSERPLSERSRQSGREDFILPQTRDCCKVAACATALQWQGSLLILQAQEL